MKRDPLGKRMADCQRAIGYWFSDPEFLETALTHSSLRSPDRACNERLEFLGDSVLGLVITEELFHLLPEQSEGDLTRIKSAVVSRPALHDTSVRLGLADFADFARGVGRRDKLPTSVVANLVESVIGAIYLDAGYDAAREFVLRHLGDALEKELNDEGVKNHKSLLQHEVQQAINVTPIYRTVEEAGPDHRKSFVVVALIKDREWGRAHGHTKKEAEQEAARLALEAWVEREVEAGRRAPAPVEQDAADEAVVEVRQAVAAGHEDDLPDEDGPPRRRRRRRGGRDGGDARPDEDRPRAAARPPAARPAPTPPDEVEDDGDDDHGNGTDDEPVAPRRAAAPPAAAGAASGDTFEALLAKQARRTPRRRGQFRPTPDAVRSLQQEDPDAARMRPPAGHPAAAARQASPPPRAPVAPPAPPPPAPVEAPAAPSNEGFGEGIFDEGPPRKRTARTPSTPKPPTPRPAESAPAASPPAAPPAPATPGKPAATVEEADDFAAGVFDAEPPKAARPRRRRAAADKAEPGADDGDDAPRKAAARPARTAKDDKPPAAAPEPAAPPRAAPEATPPARKPEGKAKAPRASEPDDFSAGIV